VSTFELLPAIDLRRGRVVRLRKGDFARETAYSDDPVAVARSFAEAGATWLHVVDLDGARSGKPAHQSQLRSIMNAVGDRLAVEVAGGLRSAEAAASALAMGAARVVLGTAVLHEPALAGELVQRHGATGIAVALDVRAGEAIGEGWSGRAAGRPVDEALASLAGEGVETFEVTAIDRDGELDGPDLELLARLVELDRGRIIASAGIGSIDNLRAVRSLGCAGAIVGRAIYEGRLDLAAACVWAAADHVGRPIRGPAGG
jgi:phosphoribosylformimino-5-aminoimidazole carboxamide ribotide isomerase